MKKLIRLLILAGLLPTAGFAWNPMTDLRENVKWTFGRAAEVGTAVKFAGGGDLENGQTATSVLAGIADYRWFTLSYGGTFVNKADTKMTDTAKIGVRLTAFLDWFKNPPTPEMAILRNINIGPSYAIPLWSSPRVGTWFLDANYRFGGPPVTP